MKRFTVLLIAFIGYFNLYGQNDTIYTRTYGGIQNDICNQIKPVYDGGYIMIGTTNSFGCGNTSFYAIKTDSLLNHQWSRTYGGVQNQEGFSVATTFDHGYAFLGLTDSYGAGGYDVFLVKTDSIGNEQWEKTYGGSDWDFGYSIQQLPDSGYIICGLTYSYGAGNGDVYIIRTDKNGDTVWTRAVGGVGYDVGNSVCMENDSLYAIVGTTSSFGLGDTNVYFLLLDDKGIVKKDTTYGSTHSNMGNSIRETFDHGFVIFGSTDSVQPGKPDEMIIKTDSTGELQWMQVYHSSGYSIGHDALQVNDGSYMAISTSNTYGIGGFAMRIWHLNAGGSPLCAPSQGGTADQQGNSIAIAKNGNIVFAGATDSPGWTEGLYDIMVVQSKTDSLVNSYQFTLSDFHDTCQCIPTYIVSQSVTCIRSKVFPNPVSSNATLLVQGRIGEHYFFSLYNGAGTNIARRVPLQSALHGLSSAYIEKGNLADGTYFYEIFNQAGVNVATGKFIIE